MKVSLVGAADRAAESNGGDGDQEPRREGPPRVAGGDVSEAVEQARHGELQRLRREQDAGLALRTSMWLRAAAVVGPPDGFVSSLRRSGPSSSRTTSRRRLRATVDSVFADLRSRLVPHALTAAVAGLAVAAFVEDVLRPDVVIEGVRYDRGPAVVITAALCATVALVALRSRIGPAAPVAAIAVLTLAALPARTWLLHSPFVFLLVMLLCGLCGYEGRGRWSLAALPVIWTAAVVAVWREPLGVWRNVFFVGGYMTIAWAGGRLVRGPVAQARSAEERARLLEQEQAAAAERAVQDERRRIARELHDIIAHSVSVMTVQAGAVRRVLQPDQDRERDALVSIEKTGRDAMAEMRRLVGLLRGRRLAVVRPAAGPGGTRRAGDHDVARPVCRSTSPSRGSRST